MLLRVLVIGARVDVQIAVAHMAEGHAERPRRDRGEGRLHIGDHPRQVRHLKADVVHHPGAVPLHRFQRALAHGPEIRPLRVRLRDHRILDKAGLEGVGKDRFQQRRQRHRAVGPGGRILGPRRAELHQHRQLRRLVEDRADMVEILHRQLVHQLADQLERLDLAAAARLRHVHQLQRRLDVAHLDHGGGKGVRRGHQLQAGGGDDAERALRADHQVDQVIAGVVLLQRRQQIHHLAGGGDHLQPQAQRPRAAVTHNVQPAGIGAERAADLRRALGPEDQREHQPLRRGRVMQRFNDAACLGHHIAAGRVDLADLVHPLQRQHHHLVLGARDGAAG